MDRVWTLVDKAIDVAHESLDEGDPATAMQVLRLPGLHLSDRSDDRAEPPTAGSSGSDHARPSRPSSAPRAFWASLARIRRGWARLEHRPRVGANQQT
jgi:hypothetical protein